MRWIFQRHSASMIVGVSTTDPGLVCPIGFRKDRDIYSLEADTWEEAVATMAETFSDVLPRECLYLGERSRSWAEG